MSGIVELKLHWILVHYCYGQIFKTNVKAQTGTEWGLQQCNTCLNLAGGWWKSASEAPVALEIRYFGVYLPKKNMKNGLNTHL